MPFSLRGLCRTWPFFRLNAAPPCRVSLCPAGFLLPVFLLLPGGVPSPPCPILPRRARLLPYLCPAGFAGFLCSPVRFYPAAPGFANKKRQSGANCLFLYADSAEHGPFFGLTPPHRAGVPYARPDSPGSCAPLSDFALSRRGLQIKRGNPE